MRRCPQSHTTRERDEYSNTAASDRRHGARLLALAAPAASHFGSRASSSTVANGAGLKPALDGCRGEPHGRQEGRHAHRLRPARTSSISIRASRTSSWTTRWCTRPSGRCTSSRRTTRRSRDADAGLRSGRRHRRRQDGHRAHQADVHFSPPVNRAVTSADVAYAIERGANPNVANPYFPPYFSDIVGAAKATGGPIPGISTPNTTTIVFHLTEADGTFFDRRAVAADLGAGAEGVRRPARQAKKPTQYGDELLGRHRPVHDEVRRRRQVRRASATSPGKSRRWSAIRTGTRRPIRHPPYLEPDQHQHRRRLRRHRPAGAQGLDTVQNDTPAAATSSSPTSKYYNQLFAVPGAGDHYMALNNAHGPFTNVNVRTRCVRGA